MNMHESLPVRCLRAPNVWGRVPVLEFTIDCDPDAAHRLAGEVLELQVACGAKVSRLGGPVATPSGSQVVAVELEDEELARQCLASVLESGWTSASGAQVPAPELTRLRGYAGEILLGPNTRALAEAARRRGIPVRRLGRGSLLVLGHGRMQRRLCGARTDRTSSIGEMIGWEKPLAKELLRSVGIPVPEGRVVSDVSEALAAAAAIGGPVVVKPESANHGRCVFIGLRDPEQIRQACEAARDEGETRSVVIEKCIEGAEHRVLIVGGRIVAALRGDPLYANGDGRRTVRELVDEINLDPARADDADAPLYPVRFDDTTLMTLASQGYAPDSVIPPGEHVLIQRNGNLRRDVTAEVHPANAALCALAAETVGLDIAGIDLIVSDISQPLREQGGAILEVNPMPGFSMHSSQPVADIIVHEVYPSGADGRIPIAVVHGRAGAAVAARRMHGALLEAGLFAGLTCAEGLYAGAEQIVAAASADSSAAAGLLLHPRLEAAVLETPERAILDEGLAFDRCNVLVLTETSGQTITPACRLLLDTVAPGGLVFLPAAAPWAEEAARLSRGTVTPYRGDISSEAAAALIASGRALMSRVQAQR